MHTQTHALHLPQCWLALGKGIKPKPADCGTWDGETGADGGGGGTESGTTVGNGNAAPKSSSKHAAAMLGNVGKTTVAVSQEVGRNPLPTRICLRTLIGCFVPRL